MANSCQKGEKGCQNKELKGNKVPINDNKLPEKGNAHFRGHGSRIPLNLIRSAANEITDENIHHLAPT